MEGIIHITI